MITLSLYRSPCPNPSPCPPNSAFSTLPVVSVDCPFLHVPHIATQKASVRMYSRCDKLSLQILACIHFDPAIPTSSFNFIFYTCYCSACMSCIILTCYYSYNSYNITDISDQISFEFWHNWVCTQWNLTAAYLNFLSIASIPECAATSKYDIQHRCYSSSFQFMSVKFSAATIVSVQTWHCSTLTTLLLK